MGRKRVPPRFLGKKWDPLFAEDRKPRGEGESVSYVQWKREYETTGDHLDHFFLSDPEDSGPACGFDEVKLFCEGTCLETLKLGTGDAGKRRGAILDDRSCIGSNSGRGATEYNNYLTATELYEHLNKQRFDKPDGFDADRRLIYIANLSPSYIFALSETACEHQVSALREAIWKHVALQPSIGVKFSTTGYTVFQFEFHLPYFNLSTTPPVKDCPRVLGTSDQQERWIDLSFLNAQLEPEPSRLYGIRQAQFSLAICGSDNRRWIAYAFDDTEPDSDDLAPEYISPEGLRDPNTKDYKQREQLNWDPIRDEPDPRDLNANNALWNPREYFLIGMEVGISKPLDKWERLVQLLKRGIKQYIHQHSSVLSAHSGVEWNGLGDTKKALEWTVHAMVVLNQLSAVISKINRAWERFLSEGDGDIDYFSDILVVRRNGSRAPCSLNAIKLAFETLGTLQADLDLLDKSCSAFAKILKFQLIVESNETVHGSNEVLQRCNEEAKHANDLLRQNNEETKQANDLLQQSNEVLRKSNEEAKQANDLLRQSNEVLRKNNEEAKQANEAAKHSATLTISIFTPFGLAAACFSMSQNVVPFTMNFRSFIISTLVMMAMANMVRLLFFASSHKPGWWRKITAAMETSHLNERTYRFWTRFSGSGFIIWRGQSTNNRATDNIALPTIRV